VAPGATCHRRRRRAPGSRRSRPRLGCHANGHHGPRERPDREVALRNTHRHSSSDDADSGNDAARDDDREPNDVESADHRHDRAHHDERHDNGSDDYNDSDHGADDDERHNDDSYDHADDEWDRDDDRSYRDDVTV
jgi:hypothetical protein